MITTEKIGFGCFLPGKSAAEATTILEIAIEAGYRYFDTASFYQTERSLGAAIKNASIDRCELFIASKLWTDERGYQNAKDACYRSLDRLGVDYLDAYLIHWPKNAPSDQNWITENLETFRAMKDLQKEGVIKNIGVSNFLSHHLEALTKEGCNPVINQLELHPGYCQEKALADSQNKDILVQAWSPLGRGSLLNHEYLISLSQKYGKTVSQICLIYLLQRNIMPIVKASGMERMLENQNVFDVTLEKEDLLMLSCMPPTGWSGEHPDFFIPALKSNFNQ